MTDTAHTEGPLQPNWTDVKLDAHQTAIAFAAEAERSITVGDSARANAFSECASALISTVMYEQVQSPGCVKHITRAVDLLRANSRDYDTVMAHARLSHTITGFALLRLRQQTEEFVRGING